MLYATLSEKLLPVLWRCSQGESIGCAERVIYCQCLELFQAVLLLRGAAVITDTLTPHKPHEIP